MTVLRRLSGKRINEVYTLKITTNGITHTAKYEAATLGDAIAEAQADHGGATVTRSAVSED